MPIRILDAATVGRIAAGEVVERPSSVVKELIENALDAGATSITVEVKGGGIDYLRVTDNGCGIEPGQVRLAFENHATSKLQRAEQLDDIRTLGFRGEALPSIAAVSKIEMTTRAKGQESGVRLRMEGGKNPQVQETGCPQGTTLVMRELFFNVPVRRAFLKKPSYEGGLVSDAVSRMLLGNPGVSMRFISGGNTLYHSFGDGKLRHAVFAVYGREAAEKMVEVDASEGGARIYGLIGVGELAKATRAHQLFFINGRSVRCPMEQVCRSRVTIGMYPMCVLNLVIPAGSVDVNVHPNKLEVRFRDEEMMRGACERLLNTAFAGERVLDMERAAAAPERVERRAEMRELPLADTSKAVPEASAQPLASNATSEPTNPAADAQPQEPAKVPTPKLPKPEQTRMELHASPRPGVLREQPNVMDNREIKTVKLPEHPLSMEPAPAKREDATQSAPQKLSVNSVQSAAPQIEPPRPVEDAAPAPEEIPFRILGVAFRTYILVECGDSLLLIDQHAAHERLQYEKLMARASAGTASQQLLAPIVIHLSAREMAVISDNLELLAEAGYEVEPFGEQDIRVRAVPFVMGKAEVRPLFLEMIQSLNQLKAATVDARRSEIMQMACKSAVKAGDSLSDSEISALIADMQKTGAPPTCPHGRPVVKTLSKRDLEKMFKRIQ
ncbi:MAG: DNA mismatch repair endonuclease MutL [Clostridia bacterium]|nr:DNA mismatch repair endonuclease MutL [Clostridia bacterium]